MEPQRAGDSRCGALILRGVGRAPLPSKNIALGSFVLALGAATWLLGQWHSRRVRRRGPRASTWRELAPISIGVALIGLSAFFVGSVW